MVRNTNVARTANLQGEMQSGLRERTVDQGKFEVDRVLGWWLRVGASGRMSPSQSFNSIAWLHVMDHESHKRQRYRHLTRHRPSFYLLDNILVFFVQPFRSSVHHVSSALVFDK